MPSKKVLSSFLIWSAMTTALSATLLFMAPLAARTLRLNSSKAIYWMFAVVSSSVLAAFSLPWALSQFVLLLLIGLYTDLEQMKVSRFYAGATSVVITAMSFLLLLSVWAKTQGSTLTKLLESRITEMLALAKNVQDLDANISTQQILSLFPAMVCVALMLMIFMGLVLAKPESRQEPLTAFKVPDKLIWVFIAALAGTFLIPTDQYFWLQKAFNNALYLVSAAYYFQGLAIIGFFLNRLRVNYILKAAVFFVMAVHLFIFVAVFGLSDVWFSYRSRFYKSIVKRNP